MSDNHKSLNFLVTSGVEIRIGTHKSIKEFGLILRLQKKELELLRDKKSRLKRKKLLSKRRLPSSRRHQEIESRSISTNILSFYLIARMKTKLCSFTAIQTKRHPYDLQVCSYDDRNEDKYYTLSGKGLSVHEEVHLTDFISLDH